ncbi:MAG: AAA family ATPase [Armatimonadota bacterium]
MWREILGLEKKPTTLADLITPRRSFSDVILPNETRQQLYEALTQIEKHRLIFSDWGLGERHPTGLGLAFNFAGPPGTGKTICAEAIAYALGRKLLRVRYSELESCWAGETGKNIRAIFREAKVQEAVLFFDEADSIAARRFSSIQAGYEREANLAVNVILKELEEHEGVVIFATNMASNFDPAFERRIRTHILFRIPGMAERERIWEVQFHPQKTPLASDVDLRELAERFEVAGGDIRNAVLKAAQIAAAEDKADEEKRIEQRHLLQAMDQVLAAKRVMQQNAVDPYLQESSPWQEALEAADTRVGTVEQDLHACRAELELLSRAQSELQVTVSEQATALGNGMDELRRELEAVRAEVSRAGEAQTEALERWRGESESGVQALARQLEERLGRVTLIPLPRGTAVGLGILMALLLTSLGALGGRFLWP